MKEQETSDNMVHFKVRTFLGVVGGLVIGTNIVNTVLHDISDNESQILYNAEAEDRRRTHLEEKIDYKIKIKDLEKELKDCKENNGNEGSW